MPEADDEAPQVALGRHEYLFYCAGVRYGHAEATADMGDNSERLARWLSDSPRTSAEVIAMLTNHAKEARLIAAQRRDEARRFVDEAVEARPRQRRSFFARMVSAVSAGWRVLLGP